MFLLSEDESHGTADELDVATVDQTDIRGFGPHDTDSSWSYLGLKARVD